jgi:hypothetical protein
MTRLKDFRGSLALAGILTLLTAGRSLDAAQSQDWSAWKYRLPLRLVGLTEPAARILPIDVTFSLKAAECPDPKKEIRLIYRHQDGRELEVPSQLSRLVVWTKGDPAAADPTLSGRLTFFDVSGGEPDGTYFILYGNPAASEPHYPSNLAV